MGRTGAVTVLAATASGLLFLSLVFGASAAPIVAYFIQLPILFCGLAFGLGAASVASAGAAAVALLAGGFVAAGLYLLIEAAPALLLIRQAGRGENVQSYSIGHVITDLAAATALIAALAVLWFDVGQQDMARMVDQMLASLSGEATDAGPAARVRALIVAWASWVPEIVAGSWLLMTLVNGAAAQTLVRRAGLAKRLPSAFAELQLTPWWAIAAAVALALYIVDGEVLGLLARTLLVIVAVPFLALGLAVVHAFARSRAMGRFPLYLFYMLLVLFSWPLVLAIVLLGILEDVVGIRRCFA